MGATSAKKSHSANMTCVEPQHEVLQQPTGLMNRYKCQAYKISYIGAEMNDRSYEEAQISSLQNLINRHQINLQASQIGKLVHAFPPSGTKSIEYSSTNLHLM